MKFQKTMLIKNDEFSESICVETLNVSNPEIS